MFNLPYAKEGSPYCYRGFHFLCHVFIATQGVGKATPFLIIFNLLPCSHSGAAVRVPSRASFFVAYLLEKLGFSAS